MPSRRSGRVGRDKRGRPRKLTPEEVKLARKAAAAGEPPLSRLAAEWNVGRATLWRAVHPDKDDTYADV